MSSQRLDSGDLATILKKFADQVRRRKEEIRKLDADWGDGDLGITVDKGFRAFSSKISEIEGEEPDVGEMLRKSGLEFNNVASSTFGALFATACMEAGKKAKGKEGVELGDLRDICWGAVKGIKKRGGAEVGDKTILDALVPACDRLGTALENEESMSVAMNKAAAAAEEGVERTRGMEPKRGRGSQVGEKAKEVQDPGATVISILLRSIASNMEELLDTED